MRGKNAASAKWTLARYETEMIDATIPIPPVRNMDPAMYLGRGESEARITRVATNCLIPLVYYMQTGDLTRPNPIPVAYMYQIITIREKGAVASP